MAYPTLNTLVVRDDDLYVVAVTTNDATDTATNLGQLQNIQFEETYEDRQYKRVSTGNVRVAGDRATNVTISLYADDDLEEVARILGTMKPGAGWTTETITLDPDEVLQILVTGYDGTGAAAVSNQTWSIPNFSPRSLTTGLSPDNPTLVQVRGISDALTLDPNP